MKNLGIFSLSFVCLSAMAAPKPVYQVETTVTTKDKKESFQVLTEAGKPATIEAFTDSQKPDGVSVNVVAEPVDTDTVYLKYILKDTKKGETKVIGNPEMMVFLDQKASIQAGDNSLAKEYDLSVTVKEQK